MIAEITVKKKCDKDIIFGFIVDNVIQLTTDNTLSGLTGNNMAIGSGMTTSYDSGLTWKVSPSSVTYTTNISSLTSEIVNDDNFGLVIQAAMYNDKSSFITNAAYVDCVHVDISYTVNDIETGKTYFVNLERNYTFDTTLENFGMIDELQYSKVNEKEIILKIKNQEEDRSIYPMVDEFGYSYDKRFIFKSSWDSDFYLRTKNIILNKNER